jgi:hypothetical protein
MANHDIDPCSRFEAADDMSAFSLRALRNIKDGEEITLSYGEDYSNDRLMVQYGFTLEGNPTNAIAWRPMPNSDPATMVGPLPPGPSTDLKDRVFDALINGATQVMMADEDCSSRIAAVSRSVRGRVLNIVSCLSSQVAAAMEIEKVVLQIAGEVEGLIASYPTSLQHDKALLEALLCCDGPLVNAEVVALPEGPYLNRHQCVAALVRRVEIKATLTIAYRVLESTYNMISTSRFPPAPQSQ